MAVKDCPQSRAARFTAAAHFTTSGHSMKPMPTVTLTTSFLSEAQVRLQLRINLILVILHDRLKIYHSGTIQTLIGLQL